MINNKKNIFLFLFAVLLIGIFLVNGYYDFHSFATDSGFDVGGGGGGGGGGSSGGGSSGGSSGGSGLSIIDVYPRYLFEIPYTFFFAFIMFFVSECYSDKKASTRAKFILTLLVAISLGCSIDFLLHVIDLFIGFLIPNLLIVLFYINILFPPTPAQKKALELSNYMDNNIVRLLDERDPSLDTEENAKLAEEAYKIYYDIQMAWMNFDYEKLKPLVTDELFNMYKNQLETLKIKNQQNVMSDFELVEKLVMSRSTVNNVETIKVLLFVKFYDYIQDIEGNVVSGFNKIQVNVSYLLTFVVKKDPLLNCPGCGASLESNETECPYCRTNILAVGSKMRLAKKEVLKQHY